MADLTPDEHAALLRKLDDVSQQAQELAKTIRQKMTDSARADLPNLQGQPKPPANRRKQR